MNLLLSFKQPFIWLSRIGYRCGYGVHSPFAFDLITNLIYQPTPYYAYRALAAEQKKQAPHQPKEWSSELKRVNQLLFRLVNRAQPRTIIDVGTPSATSLYLQWAKPGASYTFASTLNELSLEAGVKVDFLYLHHCKQPTLVESVFHLCASRTTQQSVVVIQGIHYSAAMRTLWKRLQADQHVGITFDLYHLGILFFDKTKVKQAYKVNF